MSVVNHCPGHPVEIAVVVTRNADAGGAPPWIYTPGPATPQDIISANGDMDFSAYNVPIRLTLTLVDPLHNWRFFRNSEVNVFGYGEDEDYNRVRLIGRAHHQIRILSYGDGHTIQVCYRNHRNGGHIGGPDLYPRSRYTAYIGEPGNTAYPLQRIDPIISNGGNHNS